MSQFHIRSVSQFEIRAPEWWRDLVVGALCGFAWIWALADALHWNNFRSRLSAELIFSAIPLILLAFSARALLALSLAFALILFRGIFLLFLFGNIWTAIAVLVWIAFLVLLYRAVNRRYRPADLEIPDGFTILELVSTFFYFGVGGFLLYELRRFLALS